MLWCMCLLGKAVVRSVCGHSITHAALNALILSNTYHVPLPAHDNQTDEFMKTTVIDKNSMRRTLHNDAALLFDKLMQGVNLPKMLARMLYLSINHALQKQKIILKSSKTAALWLQYMEMANILHKFI